MNPVTLEMLRTGYEQSKDEVNKTLRKKIQQIKYLREQANLSKTAIERCASEDIHVQQVLGLQKMAEDLIALLEKEYSKAVEERDHWKKAADFDNEQFMSIGHMWLNQNKR